VKDSAGSWVAHRRSGANNGEDNPNRVARSLGSPDQEFGYLDFPVLGHVKTPSPKGDRRKIPDGSPWSNIGLGFAGLAQTRPARTIPINRMAVR
jgi:hypothetical protein